MAAAVVVFSALLCIAAVTAVDDIGSDDPLTSLKCQRTCAQFRNCMTCSQYTSDVSLKKTCEHADVLLCRCSYCSKLNSTGEPLCVHSPFGFQTADCVGTVFGATLGGAFCAQANSCEKISDSCSSCTALEGCGYCKETNTCVDLLTAPTCTIASDCAGRPEVSCDFLECANCLEYSNCYWVINGTRRNSCTSDVSGLSPSEFLSSRLVEQCAIYDPRPVPSYESAFPTISYESDELNLVIALGLPAGTLVGLVLMGLTSIFVYKLIKRRGKEYQEYEMLRKRAMEEAEAEHERENQANEWATSPPPLLQF